MQGDEREGTGQGKRRGNLADNLGAWVCVCWCRSVLGTAICLFCLHEKERFLLSHPEAMKRHLEKQRLKGSQKEFIHSLLLQILWHSCGRSLLQPGSCLCPCACLAQPNPHQLLPGFAPEPPGGASRESRLLPASAAQGWPSPSTSPIPPLPKGTCPDTFALNRVAFKSLGLPTHVKVRLEAKKKNRESSSVGGKGSQDQSPELGACTQWW